METFTVNLQRTGIGNFAETVEAMMGHRRIFKIRESGGDPSIIKMRCVFVVAILFTSWTSLAEGLGAKLLSLFR